MPIYATPFTAQVAFNKLEQIKAKDRAKINIIQPGARFKIGDFDLEYIQITHSIPEMNGVIIRTPAGKVFHTGDWKFDPAPVVQPTTDFKKLEEIGREGITAMVCDSTNVFNDRYSGSEGDLLPELTQLISEQRGTVYVTTFASNIARVDTICRAAAANKRKVAITGLSLHKYTEFARATGYLKDIDAFVSDKEVSTLPRDRVLVICTGCQGEERAALNKIANNQHQYLKITPKDSVIFSSKIIPGNEKKIFKLFNQFVRLKCEVFTEKDHKVHVSGHPSSAELTKMYEIVKPQIAIPVHGEPAHLHEHCKLAKRLGIPKTIELQNGEMIKIGPDEPKSLAHIKFGYLGVDGFMLQPKDGPVMTLRRKMKTDGVVAVSIVVDKKSVLVSDPLIKTPGLIDEEENPAFITYLEEEVADLVEHNKGQPDDVIVKKVRKQLKALVQHELGKLPLVEVLVNRVH